MQIIRFHIVEASTTLYTTHNVFHNSGGRSRTCKVRTSACNRFSLPARFRYAFRYPVIWSRFSSVPVASFL